MRSAVILMIPALLLAGCMGERGGYGTSYVSYSSYPRTEVYVPSRPHYHAHPPAYRPHRLPPRHGWHRPHRRY